MFKYEGFEYSTEEVQQAADSAGLSLNEYISQYNIDMIEEPGKTPPQVPGAPVEITAAPDTVSSLETTSSDLQEISKEEKIKLPFLVRNELSTKGLPFTRENVDNALAIHNARVARPIKVAVQEDVDKAKEDIEIAKQSFSNIANNFYNDELATSISVIPGAGSVAGEVAAKFVTSPRMRQAAASISYATLELVDELGFDFEEEKIALAEEKLEAESKMKKVVGLTEASGPASMLAAIAGASTELGYSLATGYATGGFAPMAEMMGGMVTDYNIEKAKSKYKDLSEEDAIAQLIKDKDTDIWLPLALAIPAALAERYALKGTTKFLANNLAKSSKKEVAKSILLNANKEGGTEWIQSGLETATSSLGANYDLENKEKISNAAQNAFNFAFSKQGLETYLQGLVGTGVISATKASVDKFGTDAYRAITATRYAIDDGKVEKLTDEIADLIEKKDSANNSELKALYEEQIKEKEEILKSQIISQNGLFEAMSDEDYEEIKDASQLSKKHIEKVNELREELDLGIIDDQEYQEAFTIYKEKYKTALNRIKGVVEKAQENVSQKNIDIAQKNKDLISVIKDSEAKTSQVERAKSELTENNAGLINQIVNSKFNPNLDTDLTKEDFAAEINLEFASLINTYNPEKEAEFGAYVKRNLPLRVPRIFDRLLQTTPEGEFIAKQDITERRDIEAEEVSEEAFKQEAIKTMTSELDVPSDLMQTVEQAVSSVFSTKLPAVTDKKFKKSLQDSFRNALADDFKVTFGKKREDYRKYLIDNFDKLYENIPQEAFNKRLPGLSRAVTDATGKQVREKTAVGKGVFKKADITPQEFADYFVGEDLTPQLISNRKVKLAEIVAEEVAKDAAAKVIANPEVASKFKQVQDLLGQEVPEDFPKAIAKVINRLDTFIVALDEEIRKASGTLNSGVPIQSVLKSIKFFVKKLRDYLVKNKSFKKSVDSAVKDLQKELDKSILTTLEKNDLIDFLKNITEQDIDSGVESIKNDVIAKLEGNIAQRTLSDLDNIRNKASEFIANEKISDDIKIKYIREAWSLYHRGYRNALRNKNVAEAKKLSTNKALFEYLFPNLSPSLKSRINTEGSKGRLRYIFDGKKDLYTVGIRIEEGQSVKDKINKRPIAELHRLQKSKASYYRKLIKKQLLTYKKNQDLEGAQIFLQGLNADLSGALSNVATFGYIVVDKKGNLIKENYTAEHEYHRREIMSLYLKWVSGEITNEKLESELDKSKINFDDSSLSNIYDRGERRSRLIGYNLEGDPRDYRYPQEYFDALEKKGYTIVNFEDYNSKPTKSKDKKVGIEQEQSIEIDNDQKLNFRLSEIIESVSKGVIRATEKISSAEAANIKKAATRGPISPYASDFDVLMQSLTRKGKQGDLDTEFYNTYLKKPFNEAYYNFNAYVQDKKRQVDNVIKNNKNFFKDINTPVLGSYTNDQVVRAYMYIKTGTEVESLGLSEAEGKDIITYVNDNPDLLNVADQLSNIYDSEEYWIKPDADVAWLNGSLNRDIYEVFSSVQRSRFFDEFVQNKNVIFDKDNLNKIEALKGKDFRNALEDILYRMETGRARPEGSDPAINRMWNWFRGSVAVTMFLNTRSAVLQTISFANYANWSDNNPLMMAKAFANIPQFSSDFMFIMQSDYLKQRRGGLSFDVNTQDIADYFSRDGQSSTKKIINKMLEFGFSLTQAGDSFAISLGGATFYRNRLEGYLKQGMQQADAEKQAFLDFMEKTEESQQSARPDRLAKQQVTKLGRIFLAFQNTPMQYTRLIVRSFKDIAAGRGDIKENLSRIAYYGFVQNIIFSTLQTALFMFMFDEEEEEDEKKKELRDQKVVRVVNNILDTFLRGTGMYGALVATGKNIILEFLEQERRPLEGKGRADHMYTLLEAAQVSPPIGIKARKLARSIDSYRYNKGVHERMGADLDNPAYDILSNMVSFSTNIPLDRALTKMRNIKAASDSELDLAYRVLLLSGWSSWDLGVDKQREKTAEIKKQIRAEKSKDKIPGVKQIKPKQF